MRKVVLMFFMAFLVLGILLHTPLVFADEDDSNSDNGTSIKTNTNASVSLNSGSDENDSDDDLNETDDDEDENEIEDNEDDSDKRDEKNENRKRIISREITTENGCIIKIEKEIKVENGKRLEVVKRKRVCADGTKEEVKMRIENRTDDGRFRERIKYEFEGEEKEIEADEGIELEEDTNGTEYKLKARFRGNVTDIKVMPDQASQIAIERLRALNFTVELREVRSKGNVSRIVYHARAYKDGKFIGIFKLKVKVETQIDPETGDVITTTKPWWTFFVFGEDSDQTNVEAESETEVGRS